MTSVPHSGAKSVTPGGSVAGGHTKGPWEAKRYPEGDCWHIHFGDKGGWLGEVYIDGDDTGAASDARLIAAAPDAFGLAVDFIQWVDEFTGTLPEPQSDALFDLYRRARRIYLTVDQKGHDASRADAIAKATAGETRNAEPIHRRDGDEG